MFLPLREQEVVVRGGGGVPPVPPSPGCFFCSSPPPPSPMAKQMSRAHAGEEHISTDWCRRADAAAVEELWAAGYDLGLSPH